MKLFVAVILFITSSVISALDTNNLKTEVKESPEDRLVKLLDKTKSFSADFEQKILINNKATSDVTIGKMYSKKPNLFRWEVDKPYQNIIILNDTKLSNYDVDLEQVTIQRFNKSSGNTPFFLSGDSGSLKQEYNIEEIGCSELDFKTSDICFSLVPKQVADSFQFINLGFIRDTLSEMRLLDQLDQTTIIKFSNSKVDIQLKPELFILNAPKDVDVLESD